MEQRTQRHATYNRRLPVSEQNKVIFGRVLFLYLFEDTLSLLLTSTLTRAPLPMSINPYSLSLERSLIIGREKWKHSRAGCQVSESASEHHFVAEWFKLGSIICQQVSHLVVVFQVEL